MTTVRGVQALLMSDAMRPAGAQGSPNAAEVLIELALAALASLDAPPPA
jgi:hypothetical protein